MKPFILIAILITFAYFFLLGFIKGHIERSEAKILRHNQSYVSFLLTQEASTSAILSNNNYVLHDIAQVCYGLREAGE